MLKKDEILEKIMSVSYKKIFKPLIDCDINGLTYNTYYLSCLGEIYIDLEETDREHLLNRLILRSNLISRMIQASQNGKINMREFLYMLSDNTYLRRKSNIKKMVNYLYHSDEYNFDVFIAKINY